MNKPQAPALYLFMACQHVNAPLPVKQNLLIDAICILRIKHLYL